MGVLTRRVESRPRADLAAVIGDNLMPIAGVLLLGWNAAGIVTLYFAGFILDIAACIAILWSLEPDTPKLYDGPDTPWNRFKGALALTVGVGVVLVVVAMVMGFPLFVMFAEGSGVSAAALFTDRGFLMALALHVLLAIHAWIRLWREYADRMREDPSFRVLDPMRRRSAYVTARWVAVYAASFFLAIPLVMVIAYCAASIWYEFKPPKSAPGR